MAERFKLLVVPPLDVFYKAIKNSFFISESNGNVFFSGYTLVDRECGIVLLPLFIVPTSRLGNRCSYKADSSCHQYLLLAFLLKNVCRGTGNKHKSYISPFVLGCDNYTSGQSAKNDNAQSANDTEYNGKQTICGHIGRYGLHTEGHARLHLQDWLHNALEFKNPQDGTSFGGFFLLSPQSMVVPLITTT